MKPAELAELAAQITERHLIVHNYLPNQDLLEFVGSFGETISFVENLSRKKIAEVWKTISSNSTIRAFVLNGTAEFRILSGMSEREWDEELLRVGAVATYNTNTADIESYSSQRFEAIQHDFMNEIETAKQAALLIKANPWYHFLWMVSISSAFTRVAVKVGKKESRNVRKG